MQIGPLIDAELAEGDAILLARHLGLEGARQPVARNLEAAGAALAKGVEAAQLARTPAVDEPLDDGRALKKAGALGSRGEARTQRGGVDALHVARRVRKGWRRVGDRSVGRETKVGLFPAVNGGGDVRLVCRSASTWRRGVASGACVVRFWSE